jgi:hypothetical protein
MKTSCLIVNFLENSKILFFKDIFFRRNLKVKILDQLHKIGPQNQKSSSVYRFLIVEQHYLAVIFALASK